MNRLLLHSDGQADHTLVPDLFLDEYMPAANGEYVKVYLFLLRCLKSNARELSIPFIADKFEHTENDVRRALKYWEKMKLLKLEYDSSKNLTGICLTEGRSAEDAASVCVPAVTSATPTPVASASGASSSSRKKQALERPFTEEEARQLLFICEQYLGKTLSPSEVARILDLHDTLGFSAELIEYLIEYCVSTRHKSLRYIEAVALGWHEAGYQTVSEAKQQTDIYNKAYYAILKAFGLSRRNPVQAEVSYMNKWMREYGFSIELITEACSRTMAAIHQPSFEYADKILCSWQKHHVKAPADLAALDDRHHSSRPKADVPTPKTIPTSNRFRNFRERDYDFQELEKQLINH